MLKFEHLVFILKILFGFAVSVIIFIYFSQPKSNIQLGNFISSKNLEKLENVNLKYPKETIDLLYTSLSKDNNEIFYLITDSKLIIYDGTLENKKMEISFKDIKNLKMEKSFVWGNEIIFETNKHSQVELPISKEFTSLFYNKLEMKVLLFKEGEAYKYDEKLVEPKTINHNHDIIIDELKYNLNIQNYDKVDMTSGKTVLNTFVIKLKNGKKYLVNEEINESFFKDSIQTSKYELSDLKFNLVAENSLQFDAIFNPYKDSEKNKIIAFNILIK